MAEATIDDQGRPCLILNANDPYAEAFARFYSSVALVEANGLNESLKFEKLAYDMRKWKLKNDTGGYHP